jgi:hypothetical protein
VCSSASCASAAQLVSTASGAHKEAGAAAAATATVAGASAGATPVLPRCRWCLAAEPYLCANLLLVAACCCSARRCWRCGRRT